MKKLVVLLSVVLIAAAFGHGAPVHASAPTGAIFTTVVDGSEVNYNHYEAREDVYLDGGPGPGAPQEAAGLDDGVYVFMVTDPPGKKLLSTDAAQCRQFEVLNGIIDNVNASAAFGCAHNTGVDIDHGAITVQLFPYDKTPNKGGVYKVWATKVQDYVCPLDKVDCNASGAKHGFVPSDSKTDNFKVKAKAVVEIDTIFFDDANHDGDLTWGERYIDGLNITWTDTDGASNKKWSYLDLLHDIHHEAHVEAVEEGTHIITVNDQPGCKVGPVLIGKPNGKVGPQSVAIDVTDITTPRTYFIYVGCES